MTKSGDIRFFVIIRAFLCDDGKRRRKICVMLCL